MAEIDEELQQDQEDSKAGLVMIDDEYYFKIQSRQYIFGKTRVVQDKESKNYGKTIYMDLLFPTTIQGVFKQYFKYKQADLTQGNKLTINELMAVVNEIRATINDIANKLQVEG